LLKVDIKDFFDDKKLSIGNTINNHQDNNSLLNGAIIIVTDKDLLDGIIKKIDDFVEKRKE
jgi:hypothetical protein